MLIYLHAIILYIKYNTLFQLSAYGKSGDRVRTANVGCQYYIKHNTIHCKKKKTSLNEILILHYIMFIQLTLKHVFLLSVTCCNLPFNYYFTGCEKLNTFLRSPCGIVLNLGAILLTWSWIFTSHLDLYLPLGSVPPTQIWLPSAEIPQNTL